MNDRIRSYNFVLGYEESYGYLVGTHAPDKDATVSCMLICEMAAKLKAEGKTLYDRLEEIYKEYGYYYEALDSFAFKDKDGFEKMQFLMNYLQSGACIFDDVSEIADYNKDSGIVDVFGRLPKSDVLKFIMKDGSWIAIRPSGTELKIKIYYSIKNRKKITAKEKLMLIRSKVSSLVSIRAKLKKSFFAASYTKR